VDKLAAPITSIEGYTVDGVATEDLEPAHLFIGFSVL
jgi:hypothetical protein